MYYKIIVAYDLNHGIGKNNSIPWHIPEDLKRFSKLTRGSGNNAIIMGRKTWDSLPIQPLPGRDNLILSHNWCARSLDNSPKNSLIKSFNLIDDIKQFCEEQKYDTVWVIGGAQIYDLFLKENMIDEIYVTNIIKNYNCDTKFPTHLLWWLLNGHEEATTKDNIKLIYNIYHKNTA